jgi:hypothetical protein
VVDGEGFEPRFSCREGDIAEAICKHIYSSFYLTNNTFDSVAVAVRFVLVIVAVLVEDFEEIVGAVNEDRDVLQPAVLVEFVEKPLRCDAIHRRREAKRDDLVRVRVDGTVQPALLSVEADHLLVNRELIRSDRRSRL